MKVVVIDDNSSIRYSLKKIVKDSIPDAELFTAAGGVEGLGLIYIVKPEIIFVDATLPRYAGVELIDFIRNNSVIQKISPFIFLMTESKEFNLSVSFENEEIINKNDSKFVHRISKTLLGLSNSGIPKNIHRQKFWVNIKSSLLANLVKWANISDNILFKTGGGFNKKSQNETEILKGVKASAAPKNQLRVVIFRKLYFLPWFLSQVIESIILSVLVVFTQKTNDGNIEQFRMDLKNFRVRTYPTIVTALIAIIFLLIQVTLFVTGGIVILNTRITSLFADYSREVSLDFNQAVFNEEVTLNENTLSLAPVINQIPIPEELTEEVLPTEEISPTMEVTPEVTPTEEIPSEVSPTVEITPTEEIQPTEKITPTEEIQPSEIIQPPEVLGEETTAETYTTYSSNKPEITFNQNIQYSRLINILEESSVNTRDTSLETSVERIEEFNKLQNKITYQLSPNNVDWYYFGSENIWEKTEAGFVSSNTIQEVNKYLKLFPNTGTLFLKAYLISNGSTNIELKSLIIVRELDALSSVEDFPPEKEETSVQPAPEEITQTDILLSYTTEPPAVSYPSENKNVSEPSTDLVNISGVIPVPVIYQASYANGNKIIYGKLKDVTIPEKEILSYTVKAYYTSSTDITVRAQNKGNFIGEGKLSLNTNGEYTFLIIVPREAGGYITVETEYTVLEEGLNGEKLTFYSSLSNPVENSTFTVDSTGDETDASAGNGLCLTAGGKCSFRAAIQEANALAGADNIYFNIPTSDTGYRDVDGADTASSGDSLGGDDYWTIRPATVLPQITESVTIDGETQTTNLSDTNTLGPEIEINGVSAGNVEGIDIGTAAGGTTISSLAVNKFTGGSKYGVKIQSSATLLKSYIGTNVLGTAAAANTNGIAVLATAVNVIIGNTTTDGNVISGNNNIGLTMTVGTTPQNIIVAGNKVGLNALGTDKVPNVARGISQPISGIPSSLTTVTIGGDFPESRNYFAGNGTHASQSGYHSIFDTPASDTYQLNIFNNFFGTDVTGNVNLQSNRNFYSIRINGTAGYTGSQRTVKIGGIGKGNLFRYVYGQHLYSENSQEILIEGNSFGDRFQDSIAASRTSIAVWKNSKNVRVYNNFFGETDSDPYFGKHFDESGNMFIMARHSLTDIKGNIFSGSRETAVFLMPKDPSSGSLNRLNSIYLANVNSTVIGGQNNFLNSLCNGLEKNCFTNIESIGIVLGYPTSQEDSIFQDNTFLDSSCGDKDLCVVMGWGGTFELFSGTSRRTDLSDNSVTLNFVSPNLPVAVFNHGRNPMFYTGGTNKSVTCLTGGECPAVVGAPPGNTSGTPLKTSVILNSLGVAQSSLTFSDYVGYIPLYSFLVSEYTLDSLGNQTQRGLYKFDQPHFASQEFSFDGNSTTHPVISGTERTINGYTYYDRGEPWTNNPTATRNVETGEFGLFQIMEVEYVDANPILQEDGSYIITVDSTTDEDNVSTCGFDDGGGAYSGGGCGGVNGLPDGKTSLREAVIVANNHPGHDIIHFNIPETDAGYIPPAGGVQGYFSIPVSRSITLSSDDGVFIDGFSQPGAQRNTAVLGETINSILKIHAHLSSGLVHILMITGNNNHIAGLSTFDRSSEVLMFDSSSNNWIEGNFFGSDVSGMLSLGDGQMKLSNNSTLNIFGTNGDGIEDSGERNLFHGSSSQYKILFGDIGDNSNNIIAGNYFGTNKTGRTCNTSSQGRAMLRILSGGSNRVGTNFDNISDSEEGNILGCVNSNARGIIDLATSYNVIQGNYIGTNPYGDALSAFVIPGIREQAAMSNTLIRGNVIRFNGDSGIKFSQTNTKQITYVQNLVYDNSGLDIELLPAGVNINDSGDSDTGANNLMNYPVIDTVTYLGSGNYRLQGTLDNTVDSEGPFDLEICKSEDHISLHGGCIESLFYQDNYITQNMSGLSSWSKEVTVTGSTGVDNTIFTTLATNNLGSTSEFSLNFTTSLDNPNYRINFNPVYPVNEEVITDTKPLLDWESSIDPTVERYLVYLDGELNATTTESQYQYVGTKLIGEHSWSVTALRAGDVESGEMEEVTFTINPEILELTLEYPVDVTIDNLNPTLQWTDTEESEVESYKVYLDGEVLETVEKIEGTEQELEITLTEEKEYSWKVEGYTTGIDNNGEEITQKTGESIEESFEVEIPVVTPTAAPTVTVTPTPESLPVSNPVNTDTKTVEESLIATSGENLESGFSQNIPILNGFIQIMDRFIGRDVANTAPVIPLVTVSLISTIYILIGGTSAEFLRAGLFIGIFFRKRKKFCGVVFDIVTGKPVPFVSIKLRDTITLKEEPTISDLEGRYSLQIPQSNRVYKLEVKANGYKIITKEQIISTDEFNEDFALVPIFTPNKNNDLIAVLKKFGYYNKQNVIGVARLFLFGTSILGSVLSIYAYINDTSLLNLLILLLYVLVFGISILGVYREYKSPKGEILEEVKNTPVPGVITKAFDSTGLRDIKISTQKGIVKFNLPENEYFISVYKPGYDLADGTNEKMGLLKGVRVNIDKNGKHKKIFLKKIKNTFKAFGS